MAWAESFALDASLRLSWEPGNEEYILLLDEQTTVVMLSIKLPVAFVNADRPASESICQPPFRVVVMTSLESAEFRASPELLESTLLRPGEQDEDFDPESFSAWDLFVLVA
ncbi:hypothetical protein LN037_05735 [Actinomycetospora sp. SF1]|nr:hypothetical protein [Actinomycetospora soli]